MQFSRALISALSGTLSACIIFQQAHDEAKENLNISITVFILDQMGDRYHIQQFQER
jgi:hypothetical protein